MIEINAWDRFVGSDPGLNRLRSALQSAIAQSLMTFGGQDLYPTLVDKAAAMGFSLIKKHPFVDGNKRTALMAMGLFLGFNGYSLEADPLEVERVVLEIVTGGLDEDWLAAYLAEHTGSFPQGGSELFHLHGAIESGNLERAAGSAHRGNP